MGLVVSGLHERQFMFCVSLWGVVICKGAASLLVPRVSLSLSSSVFIVVVGAECVGCLSDVVLRVLETIIVCMFFVRYSIVQNVIKLVSLLCDVLP